MAVLQKEDPSISIIIVNYRTPKLILELLNNLGTDKAVEVIIVDNSPTNELEKIVDTFSNIHYFFLNKNTGFAGGNNYGIQKAKGDWIFLLNSDTLTTISDIKKLINITVNSNSLVSAPKLLSKNNTVQNSVGYFDSFIKSPVNYLFLRPRFINASDINKEKNVDIAIGAALLIHRSIFNKVGRLDEKNYFMYFEDIDWCYQLYKNHISILYIPSITVLHYGGASSNKDLQKKNFHYQHAIQNYLLKNRNWFIMGINSFIHLLA